MDWADEAAFECGYSLEGRLLDPEGRTKAIAIALRKAKADGMREAARWAEVHVKYREILNRADAVEKGET